MYRRPSRTSAKPAPNWTDRDLLTFVALCPYRPTWRTGDYAKERGFDANGFRTALDSYVNTWHRGVRSYAYWDETIDNQFLTFTGFDLAARSLSPDELTRGACPAACLGVRQIRSDQSGDAARGTVLLYAGRRRICTKKDAARLFRRRLRRPGLDPLGAEQHGPARTALSRSGLEPLCLRAARSGGHASLRRCKRSAVGNRRARVHRQSARAHHRGKCRPAAGLGQIVRKLFCFLAGLLKAGGRKERAADPFCRFVRAQDRLGRRFDLLRARTAGSGRHHDRPAQRRTRRQASF